MSRNLKNLQHLIPNLNLKNWIQILFCLELSCSKLHHFILCVLDIVCSLFYNNNNNNIRVRRNTITLVTRSLYFFSKQAKRTIVLVTTWSKFIWQVQKVALSRISNKLTCLSVGKSEIIQLDRPAISCIRSYSLSRLVFSSTYVIGRAFCLGSKLLREIRLLLTVQHYWTGVEVECAARGHGGRLVYVTPVERFREYFNDIPRSPQQPETPYAIFVVVPAASKCHKVR